MLKRILVLAISLLLLSQHVQADESNYVVVSFVEKGDPFEEAGKETDQVAKWSGNPRAKRRVGSPRIHQFGFFVIGWFRIHSFVFVGIYQPMPRAFFRYTYGLRLDVIKYMIQSTADEDQIAILDDLDFGIRAMMARFRPIPK